MVLCDDLYGEMVLEDVDGVRLPDASYEALLYLVAGVVGVVEYPEFGVSALAVQVERSVLASVEVYSPLQELAYLGRCLADYFFDGLGVAQPVAGHHGVVDMFVEVVELQIGDRCHSSLREGGVGFLEGAFAYERHSSRAGHFECEAHAGYAAADHQIVVFSNHCDS